MIGKEGKSAYSLNMVRTCFSLKHRANNLCQQLSKNLTLIYYLFTSNIQINAQLPTQQLSSFFPCCFFRESKILLLGESKFLSKKQETIFQQKVKMIIRASLSQQHFSLSLYLILGAFTCQVCAYYVFQYMCMPLIFLYFLDPSIIFLIPLFFNFSSF